METHRSIHIRHLFIVVVIVRRESPLSIRFSPSARTDSFSPPEIIKSQGHLPSIHTSIVTEDSLSDRVLRSTIHPSFAPKRHRSRDSSRSLVPSPNGQRKRSIANEMRRSRALIVRRFSERSKGFSEDDIRRRKTTGVDQQHAMNHASFDVDFIDRSLFRKRRTLSLSAISMSIN